MIFKVYEYSMGISKSGESMIVKLVKESEFSKITPGKTIGIAGTMELHVYDKNKQEMFKNRLGKEVKLCELCE